MKLTKTKTIISLILSIALVVLAVGIFLMPVGNAYAAVATSTEIQDYYGQNVTDVDISPMWDAGGSNKMMYNNGGTHQVIAGMAKFNLQNKNN